MIKPEILQDLAKNFNLPEDKIFINQSELAKLFNFFGREQFNNLGLQISKIEILTNYLKSKSEKILPIDIDNFQFGESNTLSKYSEKEIQNFENNFKKLLQQEEVLEDEVIDFFKTLLGIDEEIKNKNYASLSDFFNKNKNLLASLLQQEGGADKFALAIRSVGDGCYANIGTQVRIALVNCFVEKNNPIAKVLLLNYIEDIYNPIIQSSSVDHVSDNSVESIFNSSTINNHNFLCTKNFLKKIARQLSMTNNETSYINIIASEIGEDVATEIPEKIASQGSYNIDIEIPITSSATASAADDVVKTKNITITEDSLFIAAATAIFLKPFSNSRYIGGVDNELTKFYKTGMTTLAKLKLRQEYLQKEQSDFVIPDNIRENQEQMLKLKELREKNTAMDVVPQEQQTSSSNSQQNSSSSILATSFSNVSSSIGEKRKNESSASDEEESSHNSKKPKCQPSSRG